MRRIRLLVAAFVAAFSLTSTLSAAPTIVSPADYSSVQTLTDTMKGYLAGSDLTSDSPSCFSTVKTAARKALCDEYGRSNSIPVTLTWSGTSGECAVKLWRTHKDSEYSPVISTNLTGTSLICYDLEIGRNYSWKVTEGDSSATGHFYVERNAPRILLNWRTEDQENYLIPNGRDLGGWTNTSGKVIKQGLIYRSAYLEWSSPYTHYPLTYLQDDLGIKLDVDLRTIEDISSYNSWGCSWNENEAPLSIDQSPIGPGVRRVCIENTTAGLGPNGNGIEFPSQSAFVSQMTNKKDETQSVAQNKIAVWTAFTNICNSVVAGEPVIFHCAHGKDRTGSLGIVIHGLLGVPEADAKRDYALAWFHNDDAEFTAIGDLVTSLKGFATSGTFQAGCEAYLVSCGAAASDADAATKIAAFKTAMLDDIETADTELAANTVLKPLAASGLVYTGETLTGVAAGTGYTITGNAAADAGTYTATLTLEDGYSWSDGDTTSSIEIPWTIIKAQNVWTVEPSISLSFWTYNSTPGVLTAGAIQFGDLTVTIAKDGAAATTFDGNLPTAVGRYVITYTAPATTDNVIAPVEPIKTVTFDITEGDVSVVTNALSTASWGYTVSNLGADYNEVAVVFTNDSATMTWTAPAELENVQFLVVGGGGGGGGSLGVERQNFAGAGGAGGGGGCVVTGIVNTLAENASLEIKVGAGGAYGEHSDTVAQGYGAASHGENSYFKVGGVTYITAYGGGGDLGANNNSGVNGGSNSGSRLGTTTPATAVDEKAVWDESTLSGILTGVEPFRNKGGYNSSGSNYSSAGGGGAGGAGEAVVSSAQGSKGGIGVEIDITGESVMYGSGGSGGTSKGVSRSAHPGGGAATSTNGCHAVANQGGGGGGGSVGNGGQGGSGIVVLRYTVPAGAADPDEPGTTDPDDPGTTEPETPVVLPEPEYCKTFDSAHTIICYGDSLTFGSKAGTVTMDSRGNYFDGRLAGKKVEQSYPYWLSGMIPSEYNVISQAREGAQTAHITAWSGEQQLVVGKEFTLPASGSVYASSNFVYDACTYNNWPYGGWSYSLYRGKYTAEKHFSDWGYGVCIPAYPLYEAYSTSTANSMTGTLGNRRIRLQGSVMTNVTITVITEGAAEVIPVGTRFIPDSETIPLYSNAVRIIYTGANDYGCSDDGLTDGFLDKYKTHIKPLYQKIAARGEKYLIVSPCYEIYGDNASATASEYEKQIAADFGDKYLNLRLKMNESAKETAEALGVPFSGTWDNTDGTGLMASDNVHFTTAGYKVKAELIRQKLVELGYIPGTSVEKPVCNAAQIYDGTAKTCVTEGTGYTVSGTVSATAVGVYRAVITLESGYTWSDGSVDPIEVTWTISKFDSDHTIICYGDSLTYGAQSGETTLGTRVNYFENRLKGQTVLKSYPYWLSGSIPETYNVIDQSLGGAQTCNITAWSGEQKVITDVSMTLPASGSITVSKAFVFENCSYGKYGGRVLTGSSWCANWYGLMTPTYPLWQSYSSSSTAFSVTGTLAGRRIRIYGEDPTSYKVTVLDSGVATAVPVGTQFVPDAVAAPLFKNAIRVYAVGCNDDLHASTNYVTHVKPLVEKIKANGGKYLVVSPCYGTTLNSTTATTAEKALAELFGDNFLNLRLKMVSDAKTTATRLGITYTDNWYDEDDDDTDAYEGLMGRDGVHHSEAGYRVKAEFIRERLVQLGYIDDHEHVWGDWTTTVAATCTTDGERTRYCTFEGCAESQAEVIPAGHSHTAWTIDVETGLQTRTCAACGTVETSGWGYKVSNLGSAGNEVALVFTNHVTEAMSWTAPAELKNVQFLVVGGGGGGGGDSKVDQGYAAGTGGAGGGGGGVITGYVYSVSNGDVLSVTVGAGGAGGLLAFDPDPDDGVDCRGAAEKGGASSISLGGTVYVYADGGGCDQGYKQPGGTGGSNAGYREYTTTNYVAAPNAESYTAGSTLVYAEMFGNRGGLTYEATAAYAVGGGGGATEVGGTSVSGTCSGKGGEGLACDITGTSIVYGSGGGGGTTASSHTASAGGTNAGNGAKSGDGGDAVANCGGGGGGAGANMSDADGNGGNGGSGIVVVRYALASDWVEPEELPEPEYCKTFDSDHTIICYGDSLTFGSKATTVTMDDRGNYFDGRLEGQTVEQGYPYWLSGMISSEYNVIHQARGGAQTCNVLAWSGDQVLVVTNQFTLPASGSVPASSNIVYDACTWGSPYGGWSLALARDSWTAVAYMSDWWYGVTTPEYPLYEEYGTATIDSITGVLGNRRVRLQGASMTNVTITVLTEAASEEVIPVGTRFIPDNEAIPLYSNAVHIISTGANDFGCNDGTYNGENLSEGAFVERYTKHLRPLYLKLKARGVKFLIVSPCYERDNNNAAEATEYEEMMAADFGDNYLNLRMKMNESAKETSKALGVSFTGDDWSVYDNTGATGLMCTDQVHFNTKGYKVKAEFIRQRLVTLGYIPGVSVEKPVVDTEHVYDGTAKTCVAAGDGYTLSGVITATDAGTYTAKATLAEGYVWSDGTSDAMTITWTIAKAANTWTTAPSISATTWEEGSADDVEFSLGTPKFGSVDVTVTKDGDAYTGSATDLNSWAAGEYVVTLAVAEAANYTALSVNVTVTVTAIENVTPPSGTTVTTNAMENADWGYIVTGLGDNYNETAVVFTNHAAAATWTAPAALQNVQFLVVGGGGGGGGYYYNSAGIGYSQPGAGGGGGAVVTGFVNSVSQGDAFTIKVGAGGDGGTYTTSAESGAGSGENGGNSSFAINKTTYITAYGGGGDGGYYESSFGTSGRAIGGSNPGARGWYQSVNDGDVPATEILDNDCVGNAAEDNVSGVECLRNKGGDGYVTDSGAPASGGGGALVAGEVSGKSAYGGNGGEGLETDITGTTIVFGSGGGGGSSKTPGKNGDAISSGGTGAGYGRQYSDGTSAAPNQGGGGGGASYGCNGGNGGSGIVVLRYTVAAAVEPEDPEDPDQPGEGDEKLTEVAKPAVSYATGTAFTAIGVEQKPVVVPAANAGYMVTYEGDFTTVGTHKIVIALNDGYKWSDGTTGSITYEYTFVDRTYTTYYWGLRDEIYKGWTADGWSDADKNATTYPDSYDAEIIVEVPDDKWGGIGLYGDNLEPKAGRFVARSDFMIAYGTCSFRNETVTPVQIWLTEKGWPFFQGAQFTLEGVGSAYLELCSYSTNCFDGATMDEDIFIKFNTSGVEGTMVRAQGGVTSIGWFEGATADSTPMFDITAGSLKFTKADAVNGVAGPMAITIALAEDNADAVIFEAAGTLNINEGSTLAVNANSFGAGTYNIIKAGVLNDAADFVRNGTVTGLKSGMYGTFVRNGNQIDLVITTGPTVADTAVAPADVFDTARASKPITYPCTPTIAGEEGAQTITWGGVTVDVPSYYTLTLEGGVVSMAIRDEAKPVIATVKDESGNVTAEAIKIEGGKVKLHLENTCSNLYYAILSATSLGDDAKWEPYDPSVTTPEYELGKSDFEFDSTDTVRFFKAGVKDEK